MNDTGLMLLLGSNPQPPRRLMRAFEVLAAGLHPAFARQDWIKPGASLESCVLCSLTARDFLRRVGFAGASVAPVMITIRAFDAAGNHGHSVGAGVPDTLPDILPAKWNGHMVTTVGDWIIDTTMGRMRRAQWPWLEQTLVAPVWKSREIIQGFRVLAGGVTAIGGDGRVEIAWFAQPQNQSWRGGPDTQDWRRLAVVEILGARYSERRGTR